VIPHVGGDLEVEPQPKMQLQIAAKQSYLCRSLANANEELGGFATAILPFA